MLAQKAKNCQIWAHWIAAKIWFVNEIFKGLRPITSRCMEVEKWALEEPSSNNFIFVMKLLSLTGCNISIVSTVIFMLGLPEIILYSLTFLHIAWHTEKTALAGILNSEVINRRRQQNRMNIIVTFCIWLVQLATNILYLILLEYFYSRIRFYHIVLAVLTIFFNFNLLPLMYVFGSDDTFKNALARREYMNALKLFLIMW